MAETWGGVGAHRHTLRSLLVELGALDDVLDDFFLTPSLIIVAPPHRPLVFALETQVFACAARGLSLITLLPSKTTCEAPCKGSVSPMPKRKIPAAEQVGYNLPVLERRCIFVAACFAALAVFAVPTIVADGLVTDDGAEEEDMKSSCTWGPVRWVMKAR